MGVFDDILGGGKEEEHEEMQENIDKIREKVQGGRQARQPSGGDEPPEPPLRPGEIEGEQEREGAKTPREERGRGPDTGGRRGPAGERPKRREEPSPTGREQRTEETPEPGTGGPTHEDVPEPPELKDIDVPDIEKGPLFITVDKFRDALEAISDMRRVASDMEDYIGSMEGTLQEDRDTEEGVRRILDEAEEDTEELKDIVSP